MAIDLEDFKAHIGLTSSDQNDAAQGILDAAVAAVSVRVGPRSPASATYAAPASGTTIVLPHTRIVEVTSPTGCTVNGDAGVISLDAGFTAGQVITYTHGFSTLPADVRLAVLEMARHLWQQSQRGPFGKQPQGAVLAGYSMPSAVTELIDPYVGLGFA